MAVNRTSLQDVSEIKDPQMAYNFELLFSNIPGAGTSAARQLAVRATSTTIPSSEIEQVTMDVRTVRLHFAGKRVFQQTWNCTFVESRLNSTRDSILAWQEFARSLRYNTGSYKSDYAVPVELILMDDLPNVVRRIKLNNVFPLNTGSPSLGSTSDIVTYDVTFSLDWTSEEAV